MGQYAECSIQTDDSVGINAGCRMKLMIPEDHETARAGEWHGCDSDISYRQNRLEQVLR
jgi:hypothetical protein